MELTRYADVHKIGTQLDPLTDLVILVGFLTSKDYAAEVLFRKHRLPASDARQRAKSIVAHVRVAIEYIDQALSGPGRVAFLPAYYAILNLLKVYVISSPKHQMLVHNRWHGASYDGYSRTSQSLLTEEIFLHSRGAIPLFYEVLTGERIRTRTRVKLREIYPYISNVGVEWMTATGAAFVPIVALDSKIEIIARKKRARIEVLLPNRMGNISKQRIPALLDVARVRNHPMTYRSNRAYAAGTPDEVVIRGHIRSVLLYEGDEYATTPLCSPHLLLPEELPIALAFFHLSSVVRYQPDTMARLTDSRYWPVLSAMRSHGLFRFLTLFWSFIQQENVSLMRM